MPELTRAEEARVRESFARQTLMRTFGAGILELAPGRCVISAPILAIALQQQGAGHAGLAFAIGDSAAGYAALTVLPEGQEVMTAEMKINLLAPAIADRLIAEGSVIKAGRRLIVAKADIWA